MRRLILALALALAACVENPMPPPAPFATPPGTGEAVSFASGSYPTFRELFRQQAPTSAVAIPATLTFPAHPAARSPAIVLVHGIGGYRDDNEGWHAAQFRQAGFATLTYDSFAPRNLAGLPTADQPPPWASALADAYAALAFLAHDPRIDPHRIAIVGFSFGGEIAHLTAWSLAHDALTPGRERFAAHVAYYPAGVFGVIAYPKSYTGAPILMLLGGRDEVLPLAKWRAYRDYAANAGFPLPETEIVYPEGRHAWTVPAFYFPRYNPQLRSARACPTLMIMPGARGFLLDGRLAADDPALLKSCLAQGRGYSLAFDEGLRARSTADTVAFLKRSLRLD